MKQTILFFITNFLFICSYLNVVDCSDLLSLSVIPVVTYSNADLLKLKILKDNKKKIGIYRWTNLLNNKTYIGSSINLGGRFRDYFKINYLMRYKKNMIISKALLKYGYSNFKLEILEYCDMENLREREQYYFDLLKPEYNVLKIAGSLLGFKHSEESLLKLRSHLSDLNRKKGHKIEVIDIESNTSTIFESIRGAAIKLGSHHNSLRRCMKNNRLFNNKYKIINKNPQ